MMVSGFRISIGLCLEHTFRINIGFWYYWNFSDRIGSDHQISISAQHWNISQKSPAFSIHIRKTSWAFKKVEVSCNAQDIPGYMQKSSAIASSQICKKHCRRTWRLCAIAFLKIRSPVCCAISLCQSMVDKIVLQVRLELTTSAYLRICHISTALTDCATGAVMHCKGGRYIFYEVHPWQSWTSLPARLSICNL